MTHHLKIARLDPWAHLRAYTAARIALGRTGISLPTDEVLGFGYAHAMARDAVHRPLDVAELRAALAEAGFDSMHVASAAPDRATYLLRPDLGRQLGAASISTLQQAADKGGDVLLVVGDGLSSLAVQRHALPLLVQLRALIPPTWRVGPVVVASQARVALSDHIAELMQARAVVMLIGERPGLSSPDSLGMYLTYAPHVGRQDGERNCISNIRPEGLGYAAAARKTYWLLQEAVRLKLSGVGLKDESDVAELVDAGMTRLEGQE